MKDVLEKAVALIPAYIADLLQLIQGPKRFAGERVSGEAASIRNALVFLGISFLLSWVIKTSFLRADPLIELATDAAFVLFQVLAFGIVLCLAWRIAAGPVEIPKMFVIHFYFSGVFLIIVAVLFMAMMGTVRAVDPDFYADMLDATYGGNVLGFALENEERLQQSAVSTIAVFAVPLGILTIAAWIFAGWGAYRDLNRSSRLRSALAAILFTILGLPVFALLFFVANATLR
jgi:hypothetical protein